MDTQETSGVGKYIWGIIVIAIIIIGISLMSAKQNKSSEAKDASVTSGTPTIENGAQKETVEVNGNAPVITYTPEPVQVEYTDQGFAPKEISIKQGDTVKFINKSSGQMWVASATHPTHTVYSGTSREKHCPDVKVEAFDQCSAGKEFSFTFSKAGTWNYHNHLNASQFGKVAVSAK